MAALVAATGAITLNDEILPEDNEFPEILLERRDPSDGNSQINPRVQRVNEVVNELVNSLVRGLSTASCSCEENRFMNNFKKDLMDLVHTNNFKLDETCSYCPY